MKVRVKIEREIKLILFPLYYMNHTSMSTLKINVYI
jgi:hypothetical protein